MQTAVRPSIQILTALSKQKLTEKAKAKIIADGFAQIENYIDFDNLATKADLNKVELTLIKEIANTKLEIKNLEVKLTKEIETIKTETKLEIKNLEVKLTKEMEEIKREIANTKLEIKNLDVKITEMDKRFNMLTVLVGGGFTLITVLITIYKFMS